MSKRILSLLLALAMVIGMTVPAVYADETESTTPVAEPTFGSDIAAAADAMEFPEEGGEVTKYCPACKEEVLWKPMAATGTNWVNDQTAWTHMYVPADITLEKGSDSANGALLEAGSNLCLHLNGKTVEVEKSHVFNFGKATTVVNVMGNGTVIGNADSTRSATMNVTTGATVNLYGGTYVKGENNDATAPTLLLGSTNRGTLNIYGTTEINGGTMKTSGLSGALTLTSDNCAVNMYGGTITEGFSGGPGGNVRISAGTFNMYGGTISNGKIESETGGNLLGANVFINGGAFNMYGGTLPGSTYTNNYGTNIAVSGGVCTIDGGTISDGNATFRGGNVYVTGGQFIMKSGTISDGTASRGDNIAIFSNGAVAISGGSITNGDIDEEKADMVTLSGNPVISTLTIPEGLTIVVGDMTYGASVGINGSRILSSNGGLQEEAQYFYGTVATGDLVVTTKADGKLSYSPAKLPDGFDTKSGQTAYCAACGKDVTWKMGVVSNTDGTFAPWNPAAGDHGYLATSKTVSGYSTTWNRGAALYSKVEACFHLNGKSLTVECGQAIWANTSAANLTILGSGTVTGKATADYKGGTITITNGATVNLMGGTYKKTQLDSQITSLVVMGNRHISSDAANSYYGTLNIYNGAVLDGGNLDTKSVPGGIYLANDSGVVNMYGGTIKDGKSNTGAGNLYVNKGTFNMYGGSVVDGVLSTGVGGDISVNSGTLNLYSGVCEDLRMYTANISVKEGFTGDVKLTFTTVTEYTNGMELPGTSTGAIGSGLTIQGTDLDVYAKDGKLYTCAHDWQDATCDAPKTCKDCGATEGKALEHVFDQKVVSETYYASAPNCKAATGYYFSCVCGEAGTSTFVAGDVGPHAPTEVAGQEATHAAPGYLGCWYCATCKTNFADQECTQTIGNAAALTKWQTTGNGVIPQQEHTFDQKVDSDDFKASNATCEAAATYYYSCTCGVAGTETFESGDLLEHDYSGENGACVNGCDKTACENGQHTWTPVEEKAATCTETGHIAHFACACGLYALGEEKTVTEWSAIKTEKNLENHAAEEVLDQETVVTATCKQDGYTGDYKCSACGEITQKGETVKKETVAHELTPVEKKPAQVGVAGYQAHYKCDVCQKLFSDAEGKTEIEAPVEIPALSEVVPEIPEEIPGASEDEKLTTEQVEEVTKIVTESSKIHEVAGLPDNTQLEIVVSSATYKENTITTLVYEVTPVKDGEKVTDHGEITFNLPVPKTDKTTAALFHEGDLIDAAREIKNEGNEYWVKVASSEFSKFAVVLDYVPAAEEGVFQVGDKTYETFDAVMEDYVAGEEMTVKLLEAASVEYTTVSAGMTLDLNGQILTVTGGLNVVNGAYIMDSSAARAGRVMVLKEKLFMNQDNGEYLPVDTGNGYMFAKATSGHGIGTKNGYQCWIGDMDAQLAELLENKTASQLGLKFQVVITWGSSELVYTFSDGTVTGYMESWTGNAMYLKVTGAERYPDLQYQARIVSAVNGNVTVWSGNPVLHNQ